MLPFPIMNHYGNIVVQKKIKKFDTTYGSLYLLYSDGRLYGRGRNNAYQIGTGDNTTVTEWYLISTEVSDFWISHGAQESPVIIKKNDSTWYICGRGYLFGTPTLYSTLTDVTDKLKVLNNGYDRLILNPQNIWYKKDGIYFRMGINSSSNLLISSSTSSRITSFTEYVPDETVNEIFPGDTGTIITYNDGTAKAIGSNTEGLYGLPASQSYSVLTSITIPEIISVYYSKSSTWFNTIDGLYACGNSRGGQLGNGNNTSEVYEMNPKKVLQIQSNASTIKNGDNLTLLNLSSSSLQIKGAGDKYKFANSSITSDRATLFEDAPNVLSTDFYCNNYASYYILDSKLYGTGANGPYNMLPGYSSSLSTYQELQLPS